MYEEFYSGITPYSKVQLTGSKHMKQNQVYSLILVMTEEVISRSDLLKLSAVLAQSTGPDLIFF